MKPICYLLFLLISWFIISVPEFQTKDDLYILIMIKYENSQYHELSKTTIFKIEVK